MGKGQTVSGYKILSSLFFIHFGSTSVELPDMRERAVMGGNHIFDVKTQKELNQFFRNVLGTQNDIKTGK